LPWLFARLLGGVLLLLLAWSRGAAAAEPPTYRFGAGSKSGGFTKISNALAEGLQATGDEIRIDIEHTGGSCDNIHKLLQGELDFALVQYDVAAEAFKAGRVLAAEHDDEHDDDSPDAAGFMCKVTAKDAQGSELRVV